VGTIKKHTFGTIPKYHTVRSICSKQEFALSCIYVLGVPVLILHFGIFPTVWCFGIVPTVWYFGFVPKV
jgi:hypothetical protein